jgi:adenylosuccinate lyase
MLTPLTALTALDGRYGTTGEKLSPYLSEYGLIKYRLKMQVAYLLALCDDGIAPRKLTDDECATLNRLANLSEEDAQIVRDIENKGWGTIKATRHDVVAALTWLRARMSQSSLRDMVDWVHYGLTSEDCNNIAYAMMLRDAIDKVILPEMQEVIGKFGAFAKRYAGLPMLSRTHGQPATPTTLGKEFKVFEARLTRQVKQLEEFKILVKLNGASGNYAAQHATFPNTDWLEFSEWLIVGLNDEFGSDRTLRFEQNPFTTQIEPHDTYAELFSCIMRFNTILVDACQDIWRYISDDYLVQPAVAGEVGSSAMPHKVNPIDFENAEGNLQFANAMLSFFCCKLPVSRLQRDLSDSTVERNFGLALGHCLHGYLSAKRGLGKITANEQHIMRELENRPEVLAEAFQSILRREGVAGAYDAMKDITRGQPLTYEHLADFIRSPKVPEHVRAELSALTPSSYTGYAERLATM